MTNQIETFFLKKEEFEIVKGRLKFENPAILETFKPKDGDVIALDFTLNSQPLIKNLSILNQGDFVSFWSNRFEEEGVTKQQLKEAFSLENE